MYRIEHKFGQRKKLLYKQKLSTAFLDPNKTRISVIGENEIKHGFTWKPIIKQLNEYLNL